MSLNHVGNVQPSIDKEEHYHVGGVETGAGAKKVVVLDGDGNQVTSFGSDVSDLATSAKQDDIITELQKEEATQIAEDSGDSNVTYIGKAVIGTLTSVSSWRIKKLDATTGLEITWADGNSNYDNEWDERENLSYS